MNKLLEYVGILMLLGGLAAVVYFFLFFDTTIETERITIMGQTVGGGRVHNLGLMSQGQNGIIVGFGSAALGTAFLFAGHIMTTNKKERKK